MRPQARKSGLPRWAYFAGGAGILVAASVASAVLLLGTAPNPDNVLKPFLPELAKDNLVAYQDAASALNTIAAHYGDAGAKLRLKATHSSPSPKANRARPTSCSSIARRRRAS